MDRQGMPAGQAGRGVTRSADTTPPFEPTRPAATPHTPHTPPANSRRTKPPAGNLDPDIRLYRQAMRLLCPEGQVFEIRGLHCSSPSYRRDHTRSGYFDDHAKAAAECRILTEPKGWSAGGVYITINPVKPDCLARRANRTDELPKGESGGNSDILCRRFLMIDLDPVRISGVSSTDAEKEAAADVADSVHLHLGGLGFMPPIAIDSGNGVHLLYRIDLPNDHESDALVKGVLLYVSSRFTSSTVSIDTQVYNAARMTKVPGTWARKGDHTQDRPHRRASFISVPEELLITSREALEQIAAMAPKRAGGAAGSAPQKGGAPAGELNPSRRSTGARALAYLATCPPSIAGQGGSVRLMWAAYQLVQGFNFSVADALPYLQKYNETADPPWSDQELLRALESADSKADGERGSLLFDRNQQHQQPQPHQSAAPTSRPDLPEADEWTAAVAELGEPDAAPSQTLPNPTIHWAVSDQDADHNSTQNPATTVPHAAPPCDSPYRNTTIDDPIRIAEAVIDSYKLPGSHRSRLIYWREEFYHHNGDTYAVTPDSLLHARVVQVIEAEFNRKHDADMARRQDPDKPAPTRKHLTTTLINTVKAILRARCILPHSVEPPSWIAGPYKGRPASDFIPTLSGIINIKALAAADSDSPPEGEAEPLIIPSTPDFFCTYCLPVTFDHRATCPKFDAFLRRNIVAPDKIQFLAEWTGYNCTYDVSQQKFLMLEGMGANGKSVYCAVLAALLGTDNVCHVPLEAFADRFTLASTLGKLANIVSEIGEIDKLAEGTLKAFTSGDRTYMDRKTIAPVSAYPTARLTLATNVRPRFSDRSEGIPRRLILLPLRVQIPEDERVPGMDRPTYWQNELSGIFNWALGGLISLRQYGRFTIPDDSAREASLYRSEMRPEEQFLQEHLHPRPNDDRAFVRRDVLYKTYSDWSKQYGFAPLNAANFGKAVSRMFPDSKAGRRRADGERIYTYEGVVLADSLGDPEPDLTPNFP